MKMTVKGKVGTIKKFVNDLRKEGHCEIGSISYPQSWQFARPNDYGCLALEIVNNYVDFDLLERKSYRSLEVLGEGASFSFSKKAGSTFVECDCKVANKKVRSSDSFSKAVHSVKRVQKSEIELEPEPESFLDEYDTLELYEKRLKAMTKF